MTSYRRSIVTMHGPISHRFRDKTALSVENRKFFPPPCILRPTEGVPLGIGYRRRGTIFTFVAFCYKHDICISRITQNTLKCAISRAKFQNFSGEGHSPSPYPTPVGRGTPPPHTPHPRGYRPLATRAPLSRNPGSATDDRPLAWYVM